MTSALALISIGFVTVPMEGVAIPTGNAAISTGLAAVSMGIAAIPIRIMAVPIGIVAVLIGTGPMTIGFLKSPIETPTDLMRMFARLIRSPAPFTASDGDATYGLCYFHFV
jgi:hypothetical protein